MMAILKLGKHTFDLTKRAYIMGILNVTPDSFSGDGILDVDEAVEHAKEMVSGGADIIDVGGESTRPGSLPITPEEELEHVSPVIERLVREVEIPVSVDTYKPRVAEHCLKKGAHCINDITGLRHEKMIEVVVEYDVPVIVMHMKGKPEDQYVEYTYEDVVKDIIDYLRKATDRAIRGGVKKENIIIDPGFGAGKFGKNPEQNLEIIKRLEEFKVLDFPILVSPSRKSFMGDLLNLPVEQRLAPSIAAAILCVMNGANILRVHDVKETSRAIKLVDALRRLSG